MVLNKGIAEVQNVTNSKEEKIKEQVHELSTLVFHVMAHIEDLKHIDTVLGRIAVDAENSKGTIKEKVFLHEHNAQLQITTDYLWHVIKEIDEKQREIESITDVLFDEFVRGKKED